MEPSLKSSLAEHMLAGKMQLGEKQDGNILTSWAHSTNWQAL